MLRLGSQTTHEADASAYPVFNCHLQRFDHLVFGKIISVDEPCATN